MEPTTQRTDDDELAQQAPLVPDLGRREGFPPNGEIRTRARPRTGTDPTVQRTYDDEWAQEAPLVPDLGRPDAERPTETETYHR